MLLNFDIPLYIHVSDVTMSTTYRLHHQCDDINKHQPFNMPGTSTMNIGKISEDNKMQIEEQNLKT
jgi:hypothetical protein